MIDLKDALVIMAIIALGLLAFNQFIEWKYNAQFLAGPCKLCTELNPEWKQCYEFVTTPRAVSANQQLNFSLKIP